jgi:uncharacterized protein YjeT (DUF2065 family)
VWALREILLAFGLVLVIEGALYALAPERMKRLLEAMQTQPADRLRIAGLVAAAIGVALMWLAR